MHPPGSRDPPPQPPTLSQVTNTLAAIESQSRRYSALMRKWDRTDPAVNEIFTPFKYLTRTAIQELVERARTLVRKIRRNFQLDPKGRREHEEHESLKRMLKNTREDLTAVEDGLDELDRLDQNQLDKDQLGEDQLDEDQLDRDQLDKLPQPSRHRQISRQQFYSHPSAPDSYLSGLVSSHHENPFHPSDEVLQLRGENSEYRDENLALGEENMALRADLDVSEAIIRSLRDRVAVLEGAMEDIDDARGRGNKRERERGTGYRDGVWDDDDFEDDNGIGRIRAAKHRKF